MLHRFHPFDLFDRFAVILPCGGVHRRHSHEKRDIDVGNHAADDYDEGRLHQLAEQI
jgi:hypothetical protein